MKEFEKEKAYELVTKQLALCTVEDAHHSAVVLIVDEKNDKVKVYGLNIDESELPALLIEAAANTSDAINNIMKNRTIQ